MKIFFLGVDVGNGYTNIYDGKENFIIPSGISKARARESLGLTSKNYDVFELKIGQDKYYIGKDSSKINDKYMTTNLDGETRYKSSNYKNLVEGALSAYLKNKVNEKERVNLIISTGLPSYQFDVKEVNGIKTESKYIKDIRNVFEGEHEVKVDDKVIKFNVTKLFINSQAVGTAYDYILAIKNGKVKQKTEVANHIKIIDIGDGTTDIDVLKDLDIIKEERTSYDIGANNIYKIVAKKLNGLAHFLDINEKQVEEQFNSDVFKATDTIQLEEFKQIKKNAIKEVEDELIYRIEKDSKGFQKLEKILIAGGSANIFGEKLKNIFKYQIGSKEYSIGEKVINPQFANSRGFYKQAKLYKDTLKETAATE